MSVRPPAPGERALLLGDEAVALGALDAGVSCAYAYPGTPSTEIFETLIELGEARGVLAHWSANEKTAYEQALGVSMMGRRVLVTMKHVGLNVAMDPFVNSALVGIRGGLVVAVADDPGMHSSQNEQDSRLLADFARIPVLEPSDPQEAYDMAREAFVVSELHRVPVMLRLVTRLCHGRALVSAAAPDAALDGERRASPADWILLPANARRLWRRRLEAAPALERWSAASGHNRLEGAGPGPLGVITAGAALGHFRENQPDLPHPLPHLHLGAYPWPESLLRSFVGGLGRVLVLEEGHPYVERLLRGVLDTGPDVLGRLSGHLSADGELTPDVVRSALGLEPRPTLALPGPPLPERPPQLCQGCPHRDSFDAVRRAMDGFPDGSVMGDIGCYTLGALPPYRAIESCVCMGASIGMAKGAADAGVRPVLAVIGDSTFLHSGVTALMDAAAHDTPMTVLILDNETVGMTGQQPTVLPDSRLLPIVHGLGIDPEHVHHVEAHPRKVDELAELLRRELVHPGLSVVVGVRECIVAARHRKARERLAARPTALTGAGDVR